jgi:RimJ/RimL family protein N-acetyltransferase
MIRCERTRDYELARQVLTDRRIYPFISDDQSPAREDYRPIESEAVIYLACYDREEALDEFLGLFLFTPISGVCVEVHTCLLPAAWGSRAAAAAIVAARWIWENTQAERIITAVPADNALAHRFAKLAGMRQFGRNPAAISRGNRLQDLILLGLSRPPKE